MTIDLIEQDKRHRLLALDARQSFIVQAPAGSGKTELLIQRLLTLLTTVKSPEEILAITFTKKAANEMRVRVIKALKNALNDNEPESAHAKQTWTLARKVLHQDAICHWNLIDNPNQLRIQTIDSLCSHLTKQLPLLSHFGSQPDISDHPEALYREAVQEVLLHVEEADEWTEAISKLLLHLDNDLNKLHDLLVTLLSKRDQWLPYIQLSSSDAAIRRQLERQLCLVITEALSEVERLFPQEIAEEIMAIARFAASHTKSDTDVFACESLYLLPGNDPEDTRAWKGLASLLLTKTFTWRKQFNEEIGFPALKNFKNKEELALHKDYRQRLSTLIASLSEHENLRHVLAELFFLPESFYTNTQWEILQSLLHVLKMAAAQLRLTFQQHGQIDFIENTQAALCALGNDEHPTDLALTMDYHIQHILMDEFQDTSTNQYQLLEKLTRGWEKNDGRTLFIVGDPMQSIYRFREAEVGLFIRMRQMGIHHLELIPLTLAVNFRSKNNIVEWNNAHFAKLFPPFTDMAMGAVSYSASVSHQRETMENDKAITVRGFVDPEPFTEADNIVSLVKETLQLYPDESIAILVRSRPHLKAIIPALKKSAIPYHAIEIDSLASRQHIQDLLSLTCALLHPFDRIAWLSVLRAPWCGLSLADLCVLAGKDRYSAIYSQLDSAVLFEQLSEEGRSRVDKTFSLLKAKIAARERMPLRVFVESTWLLLGGPACLTEEAELDDVNVYFNLLDELSEKNPSLNLDKLKEKINKLYASSQQQQANLHIMTIHTAKGLEFDTVILPQLEKKNPNDDKPLLLWMEQPLMNDQSALLLAPIHATGMKKEALYDYIGRQQKMKSDYETDRLLYVAATRAKKRLHLSFNVKSNEGSDFRIESGSFLSKLWPLIEGTQELLPPPGKSLSRHAFSRDDRRTDGGIDSPLLSSRPIKRITSSWVNPISECISDHTTSHEKSSGFQLLDATPRLIGTTTHRILQILSEVNISFWTKKTSNEKKRYVDDMLMQLGLLIEKREFATNAVLTAIEKTLEDERGRWILHTHHQAQSEFALTAVINQQVESLVVDRTFVDENNIRWIIDYKTAVFSLDEKEKFLAREQKKYADQMEKYREALGRTHDGEVKLGLYFPAVPAWCEWS